MNDITVTYEEFKNILFPLKEATAKIALIEKKARIVPNDVLDGLKESLEAMKVLMQRFIEEG